MKSARIQDHFVDLTDPRRREVVYPLINVVVIAVAQSSVVLMILLRLPNLAG